VLDVGTLENDAPYIVMEFLEGQDLDARLKARGPLPIDEAVEYVLHVCEAVGEAHAAGIVHRDLKPANLFLTVDVGGSPCVKVLDFGISKLSGVELSLTNESQSMGSPLYMSPEQMGSSKHVDARSDIWSLGVILYQLIAAWTPFHSETIAQLCGRVLYGSPTPLGHYRSDAPPGLEAVIMRCLEREREKRFQSVAELAAAIAPYAPPRARAYAGRVARALGIQVDVGAATEEIPLGGVPSAASAPVRGTPRSSNPSFPGALPHSRAASPSQPGAPVPSFPPIAPGAAASGYATSPLPARPSPAPVFGTPPISVAIRPSGPPSANALQHPSTTDPAWGGTGSGASQVKGKRIAIAASVLTVGVAIGLTLWLLRSPAPGVDPTPPEGGHAPASAGPISVTTAAPTATAAPSTTAAPAEPSANPTAQASASAPGMNAGPPAAGSGRKPGSPAKPKPPAQPAFEGVY